MTLAATCSIASLLSQFEDSLHILFGFVFVIVVLAILAGVTQGIGFFFNLKNKIASKPAAAAAPAPAPAAPAPAADGGISPEVVAVIAAAVHTTLESPHRILSIRSASDRYWAAEGRREIFRSHKVR